MSTLTEFKSNKLRIKAAREAAKSLVKTVFSETVTEVFTQLPSLISFGWTQYTPYFNDGDECTFTANDSYPSMTFLVNGREEKFDTNYGDDYTENPVTTQEEVTTASEVLRTFFKIFEDEDLKDAFGDHCEITVNRDGTIDVEEYEHD